MSIVARYATVAEIAFFSVKLCGKSLVPNIAGTINGSYELVGNFFTYPKTSVKLNSVVPSVLLATVNQRQVGTR